MIAESKAASIPDFWDVVVHSNFIVMLNPARCQRPV